VPPREAEAGAQLEMSAIESRKAHRFGCLLSCGHASTTRLSATFHDVLLGIVSARPERRRPKRIDMLVMSVVLVRWCVLMAMEPRGGELPCDRSGASGESRANTVGTAKRRTRWRTTNEHDAAAVVRTLPAPPRGGHGGCNTPCFCSVVICANDPLDISSSYP
jgi:hypothetical protein